MYCENNFCVYCSELRCVLDNISINISGMCTECILINIEDSILNIKKKEMLSDFQK